MPLCANQCQGLIICSQTLLMYEILLWYLMSCAIGNELAQLGLFCSGIVLLLFVSLFRPYSPLGICIGCDILHRICCSILSFNITRMFLGVLNGNVIVIKYPSKSFT